MEKAAATLGQMPYFVSTDKAHSIWSCFDWSVERGVTLVAPYRPANPNSPRRAQATLDVDEHGVPFCRHCLGGTDQVGFLVKPAQGRNGHPRPVMRVKCAAPQARECLGVQEWDCRRDPTRLLPVWRTHPAYSEARMRHDTAHLGGVSMPANVLAGATCTPAKPHSTMRSPGRAWSTASSAIHALSRPNRRTVERTIAIAEEGLEPPTRGL